MNIPVCPFEQSVDIDPVTHYDSPYSHLAFLKQHISYANPKNNYQDSHQMSGQTLQLNQQYSKQRYSQQLYRKSYPNQASKSDNRVYKDQPKNLEKQKQQYFVYSKEVLYYKNKQKAANFELKDCKSARGYQNTAVHRNQTFTPKHSQRVEASKQLSESINWRGKSPNQIGTLREKVSSLNMNLGQFLKTDLNLKQKSQYRYSKNGQKNDNLQQNKCPIQFPSAYRYLRQDGNNHASPNQISSINTDSIMNNVRLALQKSPANKDQRYPLTNLLNISQLVSQDYAFSSQKSSNKIQFGDKNDEGLFKSNQGCQNQEKVTVSLTQSEYEKVKHLLGHAKNSTKNQVENQNLKRSKRFLNSIKLNDKENQNPVGSEKGRQAMENKGAHANQNYNLFSVSSIEVQSRAHLQEIKQLSPNQFFMTLRRKIADKKLFD